MGIRSSYDECVAVEQQVACAGHTTEIRDITPQPPGASSNPHCYPERLVVRNRYRRVLFGQSFGRSLLTSLLLSLLAVAPAPVRVILWLVGEARIVISASGKDQNPDKE